MAAQGLEALFLGTGREKTDSLEKIDATEARLKGRGKTGLTTRMYYNAQGLTADETIAELARRGEAAATAAETKMDMDDAEKAAATERALALGDLEQKAIAELAFSHGKKPPAWKKQVEILMHAYQAEAKVATGDARDGTEVMEIGENDDLDDDESDGETSDDDLDQIPHE